MKIEFTAHAEDKFLILEEHNFLIDKETVIKTINEPDKTVAGRKGRLIAQKAIDEKHLLRVVYKIKNYRIIIVTFYPTRRSRHEDKI